MAALQFWRLFGSDASASFASGSFLIDAGGGITAAGITSLGGMYVDSGTINLGGGYLYSPDGGTSLYWNGTQLA